MKKLLKVAGVVAVAATVYWSGYGWFWLQCMYAMWLMLGVALYLDRRKEMMRRHVSSFGTLVLKFTLAPLTLAWVGVMVHLEPLRSMWDFHGAGCYSGRQRPYLPGFEPSGKSLSERRAARDATRQADAEERDRFAASMGLGEPTPSSYPTEPGGQLSCSTACCRNGAALRPGSTGVPIERQLVDDEHADRYEPDPEFDEYVPPGAPVAAAPSL